MNRLGAASGDAPGRQIQTLEIGLLDTPHGQVVGEVRREADRAPVPRDRAQPIDRPLHEGLRRQEHGRQGAVDGADRHADQAHIVVHRQPADGAVRRRRSDARRPAERVDVRRQIAMGDDHTLRRRGRPRRELHERDVVGRHGHPRSRRRGVERIAGQDEREGRDRSTCSVSTCGWSPAVVTTARAPHEFKMPAVAARYRGRSLVVAGG